MQACQYLSGQNRLRTVICISVQHGDDLFLSHNALSAFTHMAPCHLQ